MMRMFLSFFVLWSVLILASIMWQESNKNEKFHIMKTIVFSGMVAIIACGILVSFVALF